MDTNNPFNQIKERAKNLIDVINYQKGQVDSSEEAASKQVQEGGHTFKTGLPEKMISTTIEIAEKEFLKMTEDFSSNLDLATRDEINTFYGLSHKIINLTKRLSSKKNDSNSPLKNLLSKIASFFYSFLPIKNLSKDTSPTANLERSLAELKERVDNHEFIHNILVNDCGYSEEVITEIQRLGHPVSEMIARVHELRTSHGNQAQLNKAVDTLKSYINKLTDCQKELNLSLRSAASYVKLGEVFRKETMPHLASEEMLEAKRAEIEGEFQFQSKEFKKDGGQYGKQFKKDIPRGNTFIRTDRSRGIEDSSPFPSKSTQKLTEDDENSRKLEEAKGAIDELILQGDEDWKNPLELAVTQSSLNQAFATAKVQLTQDGSDVTWTDWENDKEYFLITDVSSKLPPAEIEIIRDPETNQIDKVNVSVKGSLNFFKGSDSFLKNDREVVLEEAVTASLSYTITLNEERLPVITDFKCLLESKIPPLPATAKPEIDTKALPSKELNSSQLIKNRRHSAIFDAGPPNRPQ